MSNHTPGPWTFDEKYEDINANGNRIPLVGIVTPMTEGPRREEARANARLIAAAPDLLDAVICLRRHLALFCSSSDSIACAVFALADKATTMATGGNYDNR